MKRDMQLVRSILENLERESIFGHVEIDGYDDKLTDHHVLILQDAGFLAIHIPGQRIPPTIRLTWHGHDYLDTLRNGENSGTT